MIHAALHHIPSYSQRSSFPPLLERMDCHVVSYGTPWERLQKKSWTLGYLLRRWGIRHYGSEWNWLVPYAHEMLLAGKIRAGKGDVVHFLMAEFGSPRFPRLFSCRGAKLVGTFHCSVRRSEQVLGQHRCLFAYDRISVVSRTQIPFFVSKGYPEKRIHTTLHGVDTVWFRPPPAPRCASTFDRNALRMLLVGSTERDHVFAAEVMRAVVDQNVHLDVLTAQVNRSAYADLPNVAFLSGLSDQQLLEAYQHADLLFMPLLDCTANNVVLESMACGTPVMVNRVGGIPEYVDEATNFIFDTTDAATVADHIVWLEQNRNELEMRRPKAREWAERFDWSNVMEQYLDLYHAVLSDE